MGDHGAVRRVPRRPMLRPDLRVVRRDAAHLQVGLDAGRALLRDDPATRRLLAALADGDPVEDPGDDPALARAYAALWAAGLLVDRDTVARVLPADPTGRATVLAALARHGDDAPAALDARDSARIDVRLHGTDEHDWPAQVTDLLARSRLRPAARSDVTTAAILVCDREPDRDLLDLSVATGEPHLLVVVTAAGVRVGPFVLPGRTACQRCVDAHLDDRDDRRSLVLRQYGDAPAPWGLPEPADPALVALGLAWAVRDVVTFVEGGRPATWSATVDLGPDLVPDRRPWTRHPHCGCCWDEL